MWPGSTPAPARASRAMSPVRAGEFVWTMTGAPVSTLADEALGDRRVGAGGEEVGQLEERVVTRPGTTLDRAPLFGQMFA